MFGSSPTRGRAKGPSRCMCSLYRAVLLRVFGPSSRCSAIRAVPERREPRRSALMSAVDRTYDAPLRA